MWKRLFLVYHLTILLELLLPIFRTRCYSNLSLFFLLLFPISVIKPGLSSTVWSVNFAILQTCYFHIKPPKPTELSYFFYFAIYFFFLFQTSETDLLPNPAMHSLNEVSFLCSVRSFSCLFMSLASTMCSTFVWSVPLYIGFLTVSMG